MIFPVEEIKNLFITKGLDIEYAWSENDFDIDFQGICVELGTITQDYDRNQTYNAEVEFIIRFHMNYLKSRNLVNNLSYLMDRVGINDMTVGDYRVNLLTKVNVEDLGETENNYCMFAIDAKLNYTFLGA